MLVTEELTNQSISQVDSQKEGRETRSNAVSAGGGGGGGTGRGTDSPIAS